MIGSGKSGYLKVGSENKETDKNSKHALLRQPVHLPAGADDSEQGGHDMGPSSSTDSDGMFVMEGFKKAANGSNTMRGLETDSPVSPVGHNIGINSLQVGGGASARTSSPSSPQGFFGGSRVDSAASLSPLYLGCVNNAASNSPPTESGLSRQLSMALARNRSVSAPTVSLELCFEDLFDGPGGEAKNTTSDSEHISSVPLGAQGAEPTASSHARSSSVPLGALYPRTQTRAIPSRGSPFFWPDERSISSHSSSYLFREAQGARSSSSSKSRASSSNEEAELPPVGDGVIVQGRVSPACLMSVRRISSPPVPIKPHSGGQPKSEYDPDNFEGKVGSPNFNADPEGCEDWGGRLRSFK
jgi:hypothetical protein